MIRAVPSCTFLGPRRTPLKLRANLGTCMGVSLRDQARGLYHIPLPICREAVPGEERILYAETGMPLFLRACWKERGRPDRSEALIACGGLLAPVSPLDLELDLGGRTVDMVLSLIGEKPLLLLVLSVSTEILFEQSPYGYSLIRDGLHHDTLAVAVIAGKLARISGALPPDLPYTAGLPHDIEKAGLDQYVAWDYPLFHREIREGG